jgi:hypothetical protein
MAIVGVSGGAFSVFNALGTTDVVVDVVGYLSGSFYQPITPSRQVDTRNGQCGVTLHSGDQLEMSLVPAPSGPTPPPLLLPGHAVVLNVTATNATADGFLTLFPTGTPRPATSNLNYVRGQTVANTVLASTYFGGRVSLFNFGGDVDVIVDVQGSFNLPISASAVCNLITAASPAFSGSISSLAE